MYVRSCAWSEIHNVCVYAGVCGSVHVCVHSAQCEILKRVVIRMYVSELHSASEGYMHLNLPKQLTW